MRERVFVMVEVWNCRARAFVQKENIIIPTNEQARITYMERGGGKYKGTDIDMPGKIPEITGENIYDKLSKTDQKRIDKVAEPINMSGMRGTLEVDFEEGGLK